MIVARMKDQLEGWSSWERESTGLRHTPPTSLTTIHRLRYPSAFAELSSFFDIEGILGVDHLSIWGYILITLLLLL